MKTFLEFMNEETRDQKFARIRQDAAAFGKEVDFQKQKLTTKPTPLPPRSKDTEKVDFTGGNSPLAAPEVKSYDRGKQDRQNLELAKEKKWQSVYKKPTGYGTSSYERVRDRDDVEWKSKLPKDPNNNVPPESVPGTIRPTYVNTMKTRPAVPVPVPRPKVKPPEIDKRVPKPKLRPERQPAITNTDNTKGAVAIPKPDSVGINVTPSKKASQENQTFAQAFKNAPEGSKFKWTNPETGKTGTYLRKTKKTTHIKTNTSFQ